MANLYLSCTHTIPCINIICSKYITSSYHASTEGWWNSKYDISNRGRYQTNMWIFKAGVWKLLRSLWSLKGGIDREKQVEMARWFSEQVFLTELHPGTPAVTSRGRVRGWQLPHLKSNQGEEGPMGQFRDLKMWFLMSDSHLRVICYARAVCVWERERALGLFWLLVTETISELVWGKQGGIGWDNIRIWNITKGRPDWGDPWKDRCPGPREQLQTMISMLPRLPPLFLSVSCLKVALWWKEHG